MDDTFDFWRIAAIEPERRLTLLAEMKTPGCAVLEFTLTPRPAGGTVVTTQARFRPEGLAGRLYWAALVPVHAVIFHGMTRTIIERAKVRGNR